MRKFALLLALTVTGFAVQTGSVDAADVTDTLTTAWESFWQQTGFPRAAYKWQTPIRVKFGGVSPERHKEFTLRQLRDVAGHAGINVAEVAADDPAANVQVEFFGPAAPLPANQPCVTFIAWRNSALVSAKIQANDQSVWRCMLHETMHLMGIAGHRLRNSVLTYFARSSQLTDADKLLLKTIYADDVASGASPFAVLEILAQRLVISATDADKITAQQAADGFLRKTIQEMEDFGNGNGEAPSVIVRSGKATEQGLKRGQTEIQYFLGLAYLRGHIVKPDKEKALSWFTQAAAASHSGAAMQLKRAAAQGEN